MTPTWWQRRSAAQASSIVILLMTVYLGLLAWSYTHDGTSLWSLALVWTFAVVSIVNARRTMRQIGDKEGRRLFRRALRDGFTQPGVDTASWRVVLEAGLRQSDDCWTAGGSAWTGALGGLLIALSAGAREGSTIVLAMGLGVLGGAVLAIGLVRQQRRWRRRAAALLAELES